VQAWNGAAVVATPVTYYVADNRFYVGTTAVVKSPSLYCKGNGGANPQPLVENIEDLQFTYGTALATATTTLAVSGYLDAAGILTQVDLAALPDNPTRWSKVMTVRICVLVRSEQPIVSDASSAQYVKCDGSVEANPADLRLRRTYSTTVVLRNRISGQN
jgi:type IV pilus assembly protein PilW